MKSICLTAFLLAFTMPLAAHESKTEALTQADENAAREVALSGLASAFIILKPVAISKNKITYNAQIAGKQCVVEVSNDVSPDPARWLITKLDCRS